jgi:uncharacterized protein DUF429
VQSAWVGIAWTEGSIGANAAADISGLVEAAAVDGPLEVVAVDIPIGLPDMGRRQADVLARKAVGPLWASLSVAGLFPGAADPRSRALGGTIPPGASVTMRGRARRHRARLGALTQ